MWGAMWLNRGEKSWIVLKIRNWQGQKCSRGLKDCICRFSANAVNDSLIYELKKYIPYPEAINIYKVVLTEWYSQMAPF